MFSNNVQYWLQGTIEVLLKTGKKIVLNKVVYTDKELNALIGLELKSQMMDSRNDVLRTNKLVNGTKITISLNKLNNSNNLEDGKPSNALFTYYVTGPEYSPRFEPVMPQYKALKNGEITSLTLRITDQNYKIINNGPGATVFLHIRDHKISSPIKMEYRKRLNPERSLRTPKGIKGTRQKVIVTHNPSEIDQAQELLVRFPNLGSDDVIVPGMANLSFNTELTSTVNANRTLVSNIGRAIVKKLAVKFEGNEIMSIDDFDVFACYRDLWNKTNDLILNLTPENVTLVFLNEILISAIKFLERLLKPQGYIAL